MISILLNNAILTGWCDEIAMFPKQTLLDNWYLVRHWRRRYGDGFSPNYDVKNHHIQ